MLAADPGFGLPGIVDRLLDAVTVVGAVVLGLLICVAIYRAVAHRKHEVRQPPVRRTAPTQTSDPELEVLIDLTERHLETMHARREQRGSPS